MSQGSPKAAVGRRTRPFVWSSAKARDLFDSLYRGYPVGFLSTIPVFLTRNELLPQESALPREALYHDRSFAFESTMEVTASGLTPRNVTPSFDILPATVRHCLSYAARYLSACADTLAHPRPRYAPRAAGADGWGILPIYEFR